MRGLGINDATNKGNIMKLTTLNSALDRAQEIAVLKYVKAKGACPMKYIREARLAKKIHSRITYGLLQEKAEEILQVLSKA